MKLTEKELEYFKTLSSKSWDWEGRPLPKCGPAEKGILTNLKKKGLVYSYEEEDGRIFTAITELGRKLCYSQYQQQEESGIDI